jgi:hypothetical protein
MKRDICDQNFDFADISDLSRGGEGREGKGREGKQAFAIVAG